MDLSIKAKGFDEAMAILDHQIVRAAAYRSVSRTVDGGVTDVSSEVRATYNVKKADLDKRIRKIKPESYYDLVGMLEISGGVLEHTNALPLIMFGASQRRNVGSGSAKLMRGKNGFYSKLMRNRTSNQGVSYKVLKSGGRGFSSNAFVIPGGRGSLQVVRRIQGKSGRNDIQEMRVISLASMVASRGQGVIKRIEQGLENRLVTNFAHDLAYYQDRASRGLVIGGRTRGR